LFLSTFKRISFSHHFFVCQVLIHYNIKMYSSAVTTTFIALLSTSSALYFPRPHNNKGDRTNVGGTGTGTAGVPQPTGSGGPGAGMGQTFKASFTEYGSGDQNGSPNCNTDSAACGFASKGYNAALSEAAFGAGDGKGKGPACGTCWQLTGQTDSTGKPLAGAQSIVVKVNNLCPADS
jgi:hypothetical protein